MSYSYSYRVADGGSHIKLKVRYITTRPNQTSVTLLAIKVNHTQVFTKQNGYQKDVQKKGSN